MRVNEGFELKNICGENVVIATGIKNIDFCKVICLNESAVCLWEQIQDKEFTPATLADLLVQNYDIDEATALADAEVLVEKLIEVGVVSR